MRASSVVPLLLLAACGVARTTAAARPNIVLILSDDLDFDYKQDRLALMPNLKRLRENGVHLSQHVAAQPVCGPSRSSLLAGRYPHNTGYIINDGNESIAAWTLAENNTLGAWLSAADYYTMFLGKYINSMESHVPAGWSRWHGFSSGAGTYNYCAFFFFFAPPLARAPRLSSYPSSRPLPSFAQTMRPCTTSPTPPRRSRPLQSGT